MHSHIDQSAKIKISFAWECKSSALQYAYVSKVRVCITYTSEMLTLAKPVFSSQQHAAAFSSSMFVCAVFPDLNAGTAGVKYLDVYAQGYSRDFAHN